ncbi:Bifunctional purine biosynthesis protein PurH [Coemansia sp. RSA 1200]|nr:Bifunctional purine biosynthesis protein PurH [Coemansia sp. RSA 1200]
MAPAFAAQDAGQDSNTAAAMDTLPAHAQPPPSTPLRPESVYHAPGHASSRGMMASVASFADTTSVADESIADDKKSKKSKKSMRPKATKDGLLEGSESGIAHADSRYAGLNRRLLMCAIVAAISSVNYGWVIGSINIPAQVIEQCSTGPETWTNGFPSCIPMRSIMWGLVVGLTPLGAWAGSMFSGLSADRFGRKYTLMLNNIFFVAGALLSGTATSVAQLAVGRFVSGVGCGVASNVVSIYNSEAATIRARGFLGGFQQLMILVGLFLSQVVSIGLSKAPLWRVLFSVSAAIAIGQTALLYFIPESPRYLASKGKVEQSRASLQALRANLDIGIEFENLLVAVETSKIDATLPKPSLWQVLTGKTEQDLRHLVFCALFLMVSQQWSGAKGVMFYSTEILTSAFHLSKTEKETIPNIAQLLTLGIGGIGAVAVIIGMNILDRAGRRTVLICSSLATSICAAVIVIATKVDVAPLVATAMYMFNLVFQSGAGFIPYLTASEILPYYALGSISGLAAAANNLTLFVVSFIFPILDDALGPYLFVPFIVTNFLTFLFGVFLMPEAKGKPVSQVVDEYQGPIHIVAGPFKRRPRPEMVDTPITYESQSVK